ncbi:MAG: hypothetical protein RL235_903 [Chlamydiota bacterium]|jgi:prolipoprotein diacylglyceryl transferase
MFWDPRPEIFRLPIIDWPVLWYGVFFMLGFVLGFRLFVSGLLRLFTLQGHPYTDELRKKAVRFTDRLLVYVVIATVVGAHLGHFVFYESPSEYLAHPEEIFDIWDGGLKGLASHGALVAIPIAVFLFVRRYAKKEHVDTLQILDLMSAPVALAGAFIRIGNFFNQEILGKPTSVPWAVTFGHPIDGSFPVPRHPVQLYEAAFYLVTFFVLWRLSACTEILCSRGRLMGLFLVLVFGFRIIAECFKEEQSQIFSGFLTMGQLLSIPAVLVGLYLLRSGKRDTFST